LLVATKPIFHPGNFEKDLYLIVDKNTNFEYIFQNFPYKKIGFLATSNSSDAFLINFLEIGKFTKFSFSISNKREFTNLK